MKINIMDTYIQDNYNGCLEANISGKKKEKKKKKKRTKNPPNINLYVAVNYRDFLID